MRGSLATWLLIGIAIAAVVAGGLIGGLTLWGPHRSPKTTEVATAAPSLPPAKVPGPSAGKSSVAEALNVLTRANLIRKLAHGNYQAVSAQPTAGPR